MMKFYISRMSKKLFSILSVLLFLTVSQGVAAIDLRDLASSMNHQNPQSLYPAIQSVRDPFTPSSTMFDAITNRRSASGAAGYGFMRSASNSDLPSMRLRGFITQDNEKPVALLEVDNARTYLVREGDEINIDPSVPNSAIRVTKISRSSITVEAGMLGSIRVQR